MAFQAPSSNDVFDIMEIYLFLQFQMGNSHDYQSARDQNIKKRDQHLRNYVQIFQKHLEGKVSAALVNEIVHSDVPALVKMLNERKVTSKSLLAVFGLRAATLGKESCAITEDYFEYAIKKAEECDEIRSKSNKNNCTLDDQWNEDKHLPALFGIPVSIKDNIEMEGTRSTIGLSARVNTVINSDCGIIHCMKNSGMIPFIKTNLPQLALTYDSDNFVWGTVLNLWNPKKSAGGSSGGQGAAVASRISPLGVGNDMLGSVRIPAAFNGIVGLLSSPDRLPRMGSVTKYSDGFGGMDLVKVVTGPLALSVDSVALWMKIMTNQSFYKGTHDPYVKLIPFDEKVYTQTANGNKKYRIGYLQSLQYIEPSPAAKRALAETISFLKKEGHQLVPIKIPNEIEVLRAPFYELIGQGGMKSFEEMLQGEKLIPAYEQLATLTGLNSVLLSLAKYLTKKKQPRIGAILQGVGKIQLSQYLKKTGRVYELRQEWINYYRKNGLDFVICNSFAIEAPNHNFSKQCDIVAAYVYIWNVLAMPSCSLPVTVVREDEQHYESIYDDDFTTAINNTIKDSVGLPVGIQVISMPFSEEKILGLCKKIEGNFNFYEKHHKKIIK